MAKVKVVNSVWNGRGYIKRKVAQFYVNEGRAEWVGVDQLRLILTHPKNQAALSRAVAWQDGYTPQPSESPDRVCGKLTLYGPRAPGGIRAIDHGKTRFIPPKERVDSLILTGLILSGYKRQPPMGHWETHFDPGTIVLDVGNYTFAEGAD